MRRHRGFTLIELLVVVAIIALLVSILMPSLQTAKELAKSVVCRTHQKNLAYAIFLYQEDFDGCYPYTSYSPGSVWYSNPALTWAIKIGRIADNDADDDDDNILPYNYKDPVPVETSTSLAGGHRICKEGYIDYYYGDPFEGHFTCPAFGDQVEPKADYENSVDCQFTMNGNLTDNYYYFSKHPEKLTPPPESERPKPTRIIDVQRMSVLIGDGNLNPGGGIRVVFKFRINNNGELNTIPAEVAADGYFSSFGPWPRQAYVGKWSMTWPIDFDGHPGETSNITYTDGHVDGMGKTDPEAWKIR